MQGLTGEILYEITPQNKVILHIKLFQDAQLFKQQIEDRKAHKSLCLIIDDSGSMSGRPITEVKQHCARFGKKFFEEGGRQLTLISFGSAKEC